jgi:putative methyltransferase (TIGR01177 family)
LKNRSLVLLSGEGTTVPAAEAKALFLAYDPESEFESPDPRLLVAHSSADPFRVGSRIAFARRVGVMPEDVGEAAELLRGRRVRLRAFDLTPQGADVDLERFLRDIDATVDLVSPDYELTLVRCEKEFLAVTSPGTMRQGWAARRPRARAFFHPSAIFPKLSRALVNLSRCREGQVFVDPFAGTGSIAIEASLVGARVLGVDQSQRMAAGALLNMKQFGQSWLGVLRADSTSPPFARADAIATDIPYGRASSTKGRRPEEIIDLILPALADVLKPGSFLVLMHPQSVLVRSEPDFSVVEEHHLQVHKLLTRTISVLRRR